MCQCTSFAALASCLAISDPLPPTLSLTVGDTGRQKEELPLYAISLARHAGFLPPIFRLWLVHVLRATQDSTRDKRISSPLIAQHACIGASVIRQAGAHKPVCPHRVAGLLNKSKPISYASLCARKATQTNEERAQGSSDRDRWGIRGMAQQVCGGEQREMGITQLLLPSALSPL